jgi:hypothetical protein
MMDVSPGRALPEGPRFPLGRTVATHGVMTEVKIEAVYEAMALHERGDRGRGSAKIRNGNGAGKRRFGG